MYGIPDITSTYEDDEEGVSDEENLATDVKNNNQ
jgi:hypothetical protein